MCKPNSSKKNTVSSSKDVSSRRIVSFADPHPEPQPRQLDISNITTSDLALLRATDPFMFYSLPADQVNPATRQPDGSANAGNRSTIVTRRRRISVETRDNGLDELMNDNDLMQELASATSALAAAAPQEDLDFLSIMEAFVQNQQNGSA